MTNFDSILKVVGQFGKAQILYFVLVGICGIPTGIQNLSSVFVAGDHKYWCRVNALSNYTEREQIQLSSPYDAKKQEFDTCRVLNTSFTGLAVSLPLPANYSQDAGNISTLPCNEWVFSREQYWSTLQSQYTLVCDRAFLVSLSTTIYMAGFMCGCTGFGYVSDRFGRLKALLIVVIILSISGTMAALIPSFPVYVALRFIVGASAAGCFTTAFVIAMEIIGPKYRMVTGIFMQEWFAVGFMILTGLAYVIRNHITLQLVMTIPTILLLSYYWLLPESPRWLIAHGKLKETSLIVKKIARMNGKTLPEDYNVEMILSKGKADSNESVNDAAGKGNCFDLLRTPNLRKRSLNIFFNWFVNSFVFYGLSLGVGSLGGNVYVNALLSALVELPAYVLCCLVLNRFGRIRPLAGFLLVGGVACLGCTPLIGNADLKWLLVTLAMIGKFGISASFAIIYVYSAEIFPTVVRNIAVGMGSTCARIGALVAPQIGQLEALWLPLPFLVYGAFPVAAGLLCLLLPETLNQELPETILDGENFGKKKPANSYHHSPHELEPMANNVV